MPEHNNIDDDVWKYLKDLNDRISIMEHRHGYITSAFPQNDLKKPDYDGHRKAHLQLMEEQKVVQSYKTDITKTILGAIVGGLLTLTLAGFWSFVNK